MLYPSVLCGCCFVLNFFIMAKGSSGAVSHHVFVVVYISATGLFSSTLITVYLDVDRSFVCLFVFYGKGSSLLWTPALRPYVGPMR